MGKSKLLFIVSSLNFGGAQKVISNITTSLPDDYDIDILLNSDNDIQYPYRGNIISLNVKEPKSREGLWYQFVVFLKRFGKIKKLKKENKYDCVISILTSANVVNVLCKTSDCKSVITEVIMPSEKPSFKEKYIIGGVTTKFYNKADVVVAETMAMKESLINNNRVNKDKIIVIPNSINVKEIIKQAEKPLTKNEEKIFNKDNTFVTAGRMHYQKGHWHLIRAFSEVVKEKPEAKLVIFGEGELKEMLSQLVVDYKLENNVFLLGFTNELDKYVEKCRAFVMPSMFEGMPTALLQAMAVKKACIVTDFYSGAREVLGDNNTPYEHIQDILYTQWGIMTPVCSGNYLSAEIPLEKEESLLSKAMIETLSDNELCEKYSNAAQERSFDFDNESIIKKWMKIL